MRTDNDKNDRMILEDTYLPFTENRLREHFTNDKRLTNLKESIKRYREFLSKNPNREGLSISKSKIPCQIEKDERFWTVTALLTLYYSKDRVKQFCDLFTRVYGERPPLKDFETWKQCFEGELRILFECHLPSPPKYAKEWLPSNVEKVHFIPYVLDASLKKYGGRRESLEGSTECDAIIINENGFSVIIEAKVLSDISVDTTFNTMRNQIARIIDVMLEKPNFNQDNVLSKREPGKTLFLLITPRLFKKNPHTRFYGYKFREYKECPMKIKEDLPHRAEENINWHEISRRFGWATWEDFREINPRCCKWLKI